MRVVFRLALLIAWASSVSAQDFSGLWKAKQRFGPDARGTLIVERTANAWTADFAGHVVPVRFDDGHLTFALPDDQGRLDARVDGDRIVGYWITPRSATSGNRYAYPVTLVRLSEGRWRGVVMPREDTFTFYLVVNKRPDGTFGAFLRNPERNVGVNYNADRIVIEGDKVRLVGKWNGRGDERDLATGTYNAEDGVISLWLRGATYDFTRDNIEESDLNARPASAGRYTYRTPLARDDGWPVTTLEDAAIDRAALEKLVQTIIDTPIDSVHVPAIDGLLIARHGKLVLEEYFHGEHRDKLHDPRSAAKVLTSILAGVAIHDRKLSLDTRLVPGDPDARKSAITLQHLLTMRAGFFCDDNDDNAPGNEQTILDQQNDPDYIHYSLGVPMAGAPGGAPVYCSMMANLALSMASKAENQPALDVFDTHVARPMKITSYAWPLDPAGNAYGGGGVQLTLRDFAKLAQLMLNGGTWGGTRILDREYVQRATSPLADFNGMQYGYLWWNDEYHEPRRMRAFFAAGNGGQIAMGIPALDLVVAVYSSNYADRVALKVERELIPQFILPAVRASE